MFGTASDEGTVSVGDCPWHGEFEGDRCSKCQDAEDRMREDKPMKHDIDNDEIARINQELAKQQAVHNSVDKTLEERGKRYGKFETHAFITQALKTVMQSTPGWTRLTPSQKEALEMNAHKIGRILNGDPNYPDSWHDIAGYAQLVEKELYEAGYL